MGGKLSRVRSWDSFMTLLADMASGVLDTAEREVVRGDLAESGEFGWQSFHQVLGLVVRRRILSLKSGDPWIILATLTIPMAVLLSLMAGRISDGSAIYLWMWINNSDWAIIDSTGFWRLVLDFAPGVVLSYIALACFSWTCGLLIGWSARRTRWLSGLVLLAIVFAVGALGVPRSFGQILVLQRARDFDGNAAVFLAPFYQRVLPVILEVILVILPAWRGMHQGSRIVQIGHVVRCLMLLISIVVVGVLVSQNLLWWQMRVWAIWPLRFPRLPSFAPLALAAPTSYLLLIIRRRSILRRAGLG